MVAFLVWQVKGAECFMAVSRKRKTKPGKGRSQNRPQPQIVERSPRTDLLSLRGYILGFLGFCATVLALWDAIAKTDPLVTPQAMESSSSVLHFKVENPSFIFDMRDVTLACQVRKIETGPASQDAPVRFITPLRNDNGRVQSEKSILKLRIAAP
jgi:hypothetical protein